MHPGPRTTRLLVTGFIGLNISLCLLSACDDSERSEIEDMDVVTDTAADQDMADADGRLMDTTDGRDSAADTPDDVVQDNTPDVIADDPFAPSCAVVSDLPSVHPADPMAAGRGRALFVDGPLGKGIIPRLGIENLWLVWGGGQLTGDAYWQEFQARYGFHEAPFQNDGLPLGMKEADNGMVTFDCMMCHSGKVAGQIVIGAPNSRLDMEALYDDLVALNELAPQFGFPQLPIPFELDGYTIAAGTGDAFGLTFDLALAGMDNPGLNDDYGWQRSAGWWTARYKDHIYTDGIGQSGGHRTMMAAMFGFGLTASELEMMDDEFNDIANMIYDLEAPCYPEEVDGAAVERGRALFDGECSSCHGVHSGPSADFPDLLVSTEMVGTDQMREDSWTQQEATAVNSTWFGDPPMQDTDGYLAQPLVGIWARAPYLHNGSVPDLASLLSPAQRPERWRRTGSESDDYDFVRVGWRYETVAQGGDTNTREGRQIYDTTLPGLSNDGHEYGMALTESQKADLLEYLKTL